MNDEFRFVAGRIHDANDYHDLFAVGDHTALKSGFRSMMKYVHPDTVDESSRAEANDVMAKLNRLYDDAAKAVTDGTFDAPRPVLVLSSARQRHDCLARRTRWTDMTDMYEARSGSSDTLVKIARRPTDNDLLEAETSALTALQATGSEHVMYYPKLIDNMTVQDGRRRLKATVQERLNGFYNLEQVHERYPAGIHPLDMGWIWRRTLWALGGAHEAGYIHGALVPSHIIIHPTLHGVVLVDWCYSVNRTMSDYPALSAIVRRFRDWYPDSVLQRNSPRESLDTRFAARCMLFIMGSQPVPSTIMQHLQGVATGAIDESAYELLIRFDRILERLGAPYYPRSYRPLNW